MPHIFSVRELTRAVKDVLEGEFPFVWVQGQVGGVSRPGSGHLYFTLKDEDALLNVVWFKSNQWQRQGTGATGLAEGLEVVCAGRMAVYAPRGTYQLLAEFVQEQGIGQLFLQFEALKKKLAAEGLFDREAKRSLPSHPCRIGVVTAPGGAAVRDFLRLAQGRGYGASIRIYPSLMQGDGAVDNVVLALEQANLEKWAQVLVLIRGGGSLEDLWTFNTEEVARAVRGSAIPVLTGIGHEVDTTIADLAADLRASTPSHAAQLLWPERSQLLQEIDELDSRLHTGFNGLIRQKNERVKSLARAVGWLSPGRRLERMEHRLVRELKALTGRSAGMFLRHDSRFQGLVRRLARTSTDATNRWRLQHITTLQGRLLQAAQGVVAAKRGHLQQLESGLRGLDPGLPLQRGYSLVRRRSDGSLLRDPTDVASGDVLDITLQKGELRAVAAPNDRPDDHDRDRDR